MPWRALCFVQMFSILSCTQIENINLEMMLKGSDKPKLIYMSDLHYKSDVLYKEFKAFSRQNRNYDYYRCDCGDVRNYPLIYSHDVRVLPTLVIISEDGTTSDVLPNGSNVSQWLNSLSFDGCKIKKLKCHNYLNELKGDNVTIDNEIRNVRLEPNDFYSYYLKFQIESLLGNVDSANFYISKSIQFYESNPDASKVLLFRELLANYKSEAPVLVFDSLSVNLGEIASPGKYETVLKYKNYSPQTAVVLSAITSCSCLEVKYDKIVEPYSEGTLNIVYRVDDIPLESVIQREVYLITNAHTENFTIIINAKH